MRQSAHCTQVVERRRCLEGMHVRACVGARVGLTEVPAGPMLVAVPASVTSNDASVFCWVAMIL